MFEKNGLVVTHLRILFRISFEKRINLTDKRKPNQLTKYPLLAYAPMHKLAGHFLLSPDANAFSRKDPPLDPCLPA